MDLFLQRGVRLLTMRRFHLDQLQLVASGHEDTQVDGQHQQQGNQYTGEKVEVDHVLHDYHRLKQACHQTGRAGAAAARGQIVPTHHRGQTDDDGQHPADGDDPLRPLARHQAIVPEEGENTNVKIA